MVKHVAVVCGSHRAPVTGCGFLQKAAAAAWSWWCSATYLHLSALRFLAFNMMVSLQSEQLRLLAAAHYLRLRQVFEGAQD